MTWDEIRAEAFGEIGLLPKDFYKMRLKDYLLLKKGFFNKRVYEQRIMRRVVATVIAPWLKQSPSFYNIWPLPGDAELKKQIGDHISEEAKKTLAMFRERPNENLN